MCSKPWFVGLTCGSLLGLILAFSLATACKGRQSPAAAQEPTSASAVHNLKKTNLTYPDRIAWRDVLKWPEDCESSFNYADKSFAGLDFFELAAQHYLVQVTCNLGTYQGTYVFLLLDESHSAPGTKLLTFVGYEDSGEPGTDRLQKQRQTELTGTPQFDPKTKRLRLINKFRGMGDCGFVATYAFAQDAPKLVRLQAKLNCDDKTVPGPEHWDEITPP